ncbi:MAG: PEP-CTERM sorting domain-containing protein [Armatimonadetes bacterium]|nr:PEP-CTERM sorting domain-containing protein [Armatimonadota bacterium]
MSYASNTLFAFGYGDSLMPTTAQGGGGGSVFGPFSYGTGWQHTVVAVPEPGTWMLLALGVVPVIRRRRRK